MFGVALSAEWTEGGATVDKKIQKQDPWHGTVMWFWSNEICYLCIMWVLQENHIFVQMQYM